MNKSNVDIAVAYYQAIGDKRVNDIGKYLHTDVQFASPFATLAGKEKVAEWIKKFTTFFTSLKIRTQFGCDQQAVIIYDLQFPAPIGSCPAAALLSFDQGLIAKIELFFDGRPFDKNR